MQKLLYFLAVCLLATACKQQTPNTNVDASPAPSNTANQTQAAPALQFVEQDLSPKNNNSGFEISIKTLAVSGGAAGVSDAMNAELQKNLIDRLQSYGSSPKNNTPEELIKSAIAEYEAAKEENPDEMGWSLELGYSIDFQSDKIVAISRNEYSSTGGAHPNGHTSFLNFDPKTGKLLTNADLIADEKGLLPVVEKYFRKHWAEALGGNLNGDLNEAGFMFDNGFQLPKNISIDKNNLILFYNTYEIAPYVMGETDLRIPLSEVKQFLK